MNSEDIRSKMAEIITQRICHNLTPEQVVWDAKLRDDLGIDSLAASELLYEIREEFGADLDESSVASLLTVRDAVTAISRCLRAA